MQEELSSLLETLCGGAVDKRRSQTKGNSSDILLLLMDPTKLVELLQICTFVAQGKLHARTYLLLS